MTKDDVKVGLLLPRHSCYMTLKADTQAIQASWSKDKEKQLYADLKGGSGRGLR